MDDWRVIITKANKLVCVLHTINALLLEEGGAQNASGSHDENESLGLNTFGHSH